MLDCPAAMANVHFEQVDPNHLTRAILEVVKYSTRTVPEKSATKAPGTQAPAMTEWPGHLWREWWQAQQGFRRTPGKYAAATAGILSRIPSVMVAALATARAMAPGPD